MELNDDRLFKLQLNRMAFLRPAERQTLTKKLGSTAALDRLSRHALQFLLGRPVPAELWQPSRWKKGLERDIKFLTRGWMSCIFHGDDDYPARLSEIFDPPVALYYRGTLPDLSCPPVAGAFPRWRQAGAKNREACPCKTKPRADRKSLSTARDNHRLREKYSSSIPGSRI